MADTMYRKVEGYYLHVSFPEECVRSALRYEPQPRDLFIVSYPKSGTTWMQHIVYGIFHGRSPPKDVVTYYREMPFIEFKGANSARYMPRPGAIKTHMPFQFQPYSKDAKYIYITRNPHDYCVSFFYHTKAMPEYRFKDGTFDEFFEMFIEGTADFGDYFDHVLSWYEHRNDPNVLFLTYEDLKKYTAAWVLKTADLIGYEYVQQYEKIKTIPEEEKPEWLKEVTGALVEDVLQMKGDFARKGVVGDWRNHFSADQVKRLKKRIEFKTRGKDLMDL